MFQVVTFDFEVCSCLTCLASDWPCLLNRWIWSGCVRLHRYQHNKFGWVDGSMYREARGLLGRAYLSLYVAWSTNGMNMNKFHRIDIIHCSALCEHKVEYRLDVLTQSSQQLQCLRSASFNYPWSSPFSNSSVLNSSFFFKSHRQCKPRFCATWLYWIGFASHSLVVSNTLNLDKRIDWMGLVGWIFGYSCVYAPVYVTFS
jgi:hypothetical protein